MGMRKERESAIVIAHRTVTIAFVNDINKRHCRTAVVLQNPALYYNLSKRPVDEKTAGKAYKRGGFQCPKFNLMKDTYKHAVNNLTFFSRKYFFRSPTITVFLELRNGKLYSIGKEIQTTTL